MRTLFASTLAVAALALGISPLAQAQMGPDHAMGPDQWGDHRPGPAGPGRPGGPQQILPRDQSLRLRSELGALSDQIARAQGSRRISQGGGRGLMAEVSSVRRGYWARMRNGLTRSEYDSTSAQIAHIRAQFEGMLAQHDRRPG